MRIQQFIFIVITAYHHSMSFMLHACCVKIFVSVKPYNNIVMFKLMSNIQYQQNCVFSTLVRKPT